MDRVGYSMPALSLVQFPQKTLQPSLKAYEGTSPLIHGLERGFGGLRCFERTNTAELAPDRQARMVALVLRHFSDAITGNGDSFVCCTRPAHGGRRSLRFLPRARHARTSEFGGGFQHLHSL